MSHTTPKLLKKITSKLKLVFTVLDRSVVPFDHRSWSIVDLK